MSNTLIVFASKYGTTQKIAQKIAAGLKATAVCYDCKTQTIISADSQQKVKQVNLADYGTIILGTAMYIGMPLSAFKKFCATHEKELLSHPVGLFTCGVGTSQEDEGYLRKALPAALNSHATSYAHLGGDVVPERMNAFERMAMKEYVKQHGPAAGINEQAIAEFCDALNKLTGSL